MDKDKMNRLGYRMGQFLAVVIAACVTVLISSFLIGITLTFMRWMLF